MVTVLVGGATTTIAPSDSGEIAPAFSDESPAPVQVVDILPSLMEGAF